MEGDGTNIFIIIIYYISDNIVLRTYVFFFFLISFFTCGCFCWFVCLLLWEKKNIVLETIMWTPCLEPLIFFFPIFTF